VILDVGQKKYLLHSFEFFLHNMIVHDVICKTFKKFHPSKPVKKFLFIFFSMVLLVPIYSLGCVKFYSLINFGRTLYPYTLEYHSAIGELNRPAYFLNKTFMSLFGYKISYCRCGELGIYCQYFTNDDYESAQQGDAPERASPAR